MRVRHRRPDRVLGRPMHHVSVRLLTVVGLGVGWTVGSTVGPLVGTSDGACRAQRNPHASAPHTQVCLVVAAACLAPRTCVGVLVGPLDGRPVGTCHDDVITRNSCDTSGPLNLRLDCSWMRRLPYPCRAQAGSRRGSCRCESRGRRGALPSIRRQAQSHSRVGPGQLQLSRNAALHTAEARQWPALTLVGASVGFDVGAVVGPCCRTRPQSRQSGHVIVRTFSSQQSM